MFIYWICGTYGWDADERSPAVDGKTPVLVTTEEKAHALRTYLLSLGVRHERLGCWDPLTAYDETERGLVGFAVHPDHARPHHREFVRRFGPHLTEGVYQKFLQKLPVVRQYEGGPLPEVTPLQKERLW